MVNSVWKPISLPADLAEEVENLARREGKTASEVIRDALRTARSVRLKEDYSRGQGFWSQIAKEKGLLSDEDLERLLTE